MQITSTDSGSQPANFWTKDLNISEISLLRVAEVCFLQGLAVFGVLSLLLGPRRVTVKAHSFHYNNKLQMPI